MDHGEFGLFGAAVIEILYTSSEESFIYSVGETSFQISLSVKYTNINQAMHSCFGSYENCSIFINTAQKLVKCINVQY